MLIERFRRTSRSQHPLSVGALLFCLKLSVACSQAPITPPSPTSNSPQTPSENDNNSGKHALLDGNSATDRDTASVASSKNFGAVHGSVKRSGLIPGRFVVSLKPSAGNVRTAQSKVNLLLSAEESLKAKIRTRLTRTLNRVPVDQSINSKRYNPDLLTLEVSDLKNRDTNDTAVLLKQLQAEANSDIRVEGDYWVHTQTDFRPNDPYFPPSSGAWGQPFADQWPLEKLQITNASGELTNAWALSQGAGQIVAVIDTGVDYNHPDLAGQVIRGWDFINDDDDPMDDNFHGTHVAGTIAALANNGLGIAGVAPQARVLAIKSLDAFGSGGTSAIANAIRYAADHGAHVINLSLGSERLLQFGEVPEFYTEAVEYAHQRNVVIVAAAGNAGREMRGFFPASDPHVISVGATTSRDEKSSFSNFGQRLNLSAPGGDHLVPGQASLGVHRTILSLKTHQFNGQPEQIVHDRYLRLAGTSMASPHVAAVAALLRAKFPSYSNEQIRQILLIGADDLGAPGFDPHFGVGRLNAKKALEISYSPIEVLIKNKNTLVASRERPLELYGVVSGSNLERWEINTIDSMGQLETVLRGNNNISGVFGTVDLSTRPISLSATIALELVAYDNSNRKFTHRTDVLITNTPEAPTDLQGTPGNNQITLNWNGPSNTNSFMLTNYSIQYSADSGKTWSTPSLTGSTSTSFAVTGLSNGTAYLFRVAAVNAAGTGIYSTNSQSLTPGGTLPPGAPTSVAGTRGNAQVALTWAAPSSNGGSVITSYSIQYSADSGKTWSTPSLTGSTSTSFAVTGLSNGTAYVFRVAAVNVAGSGSYSSNSARVVPLEPPGAPTSVAGTRGNAQVALTWLAPPSNGGSAITDYSYQFSTNGGTTWSLPRLTGSTSTSFTVTGLSNGTPYVFRVAAVNVAGSGSYSSNSASVAPFGPPSPPTRVAGTRGNARVALTWAAPPSNGGSAITNYSYQFSTNGGTTWSTPRLTGSTSTSFTVTGLSNGRAYVFRVAAVNATGTGSYSSSSASVTPRR